MNPYGNDFLAPQFAYFRYFGSNQLFIPDFFRSTDDPVYYNWRKLATKFPFAEKRNGIPLWRGSTTGGMYSVDNYLVHRRSKLVNLSKHYPNIIDAHFASCSQCVGNVSAALVSTFGEFQQSVPYPDQFMYKYHIDVDGNGWSSRFRLLLSLQSIVFKQNSRYEMHFETELDDAVILFKPDLSDLLQKIEEVRSWPIWKQRNVALKAQHLFETYLERDKLLCYLHSTLTLYGQLHVRLV
jgi:hypothetical protein